MFLNSSDEAKPVVEDKLSEVASALISAYDSGELGQALAEGDDGWKKWVKAFGKTHKRKVSINHVNCGLLLLPAKPVSIENIFNLN
jgi:glutamyl-tRNA synthetase